MKNREMGTRVECRDGGRVQKEGEWHGGEEREKAEEGARERDVYMSCEGGNERKIRLIAMTISIREGGSRWQRPYRCLSDSHISWAYRHRPVLNDDTRARGHTSVPSSTVVFFSNDERIANVTTEHNTRHDTTRHKERRATTTGRRSSKIERTAWLSLDAGVTTRSTPPHLPWHPRC